MSELAYYSTERLWLFNRHNRDSYLADEGVQAPPWDPTRRCKYWQDHGIELDTAHPSTTYNYFDMSARAFKTFSITREEARQLNLPGLYVFPPFVVAPTPAVIVQGDNSTGAVSINPNLLCSMEQARMLAEELGGVVVESPGFTNGPFRIEWRGETRRYYLIRIGSQSHVAAQLLRELYRNGVGAPGEWVMDGLYPQWIGHNQETGERDNRPEVPMPCRLLADNEALYLSHPMSVVVYRTDLESPYNPLPAGGAGGGGLTPEQDERLKQIDSTTQAIFLQLLGYPPQ